MVRQDFLFIALAIMSVALSIHWGGMHFFRH